MARFIVGIVTDHGAWMKGTQMRVVDTDEDAARLAELLNGNDRTRPIVVVSTPSGRAEPWIDASEIERRAR